MSEDEMSEDENECIGCGETIMRGAFIAFCEECGDGPFCDGFCLDEHEEDEHAPRCFGCGKVLEVDPPCPVCRAELCDDCFPTHVDACKRRVDFERHQLFLTQFEGFTDG